jgi:hypothetical protein
VRTASSGSREISSQKPLAQSHTPRSPMTDPVIASALNLAARAIEKAPSLFVQMPRSKFAIPSSAQATAPPSMIHERRCSLATGL